MYAVAGTETRHVDLRVLADRSVQRLCGHPQLYHYGLAGKYGVSLSPHRNPSERRKTAWQEKVKSETVGCRHNSCLSAAVCRFADRSVADQAFAPAAACRHLYFAHSHENPDDHSGKLGRYCGEFAVHRDRYCDRACRRLAAGVSDRTGRSRFSHWGAGGLTIVSCFNAVPVVALAPVIINWTRDVSNDVAFRSMVAKCIVVMIFCTATMSINAFRGLTEVKPFSEDLMRSYAANRFTVF